MRRLAIAVALAVLAACGGGGGDDGAETPKSACDVTALPISVSVVNGWPGLDPVAYAQELADNCQTLTEIEALPWFDRYGACDGAHPGLCTEPFREQRRAFLQAMSAHGITTHIVPQNSNAAGPWKKSDEWFREHVREIREDAEELAAGLVWCGPPSEPWRYDDKARGRRRAEIAREECPGKFVMPDAGANHATGRPYWSGIAYDLLEVHPCNDNAAIDSIRRGLPILTVTDCSPVLNPGPERAARLAREAVRVGAPLVLYDFRATAPDLVTIDAVGAVIREGVAR